MLKQKPSEKLAALDKEQDEIMSRMSAKMNKPEDRERLDLIEEEMMMAKSSLRAEQIKADNLKPVA